MKKILCVLFSCLYVTLAFAQVDNYALNFDGQGSVNYRKIPELNGLSAYTLQFWICPSEWNSRATVFARGEGASLFGMYLGEAPGSMLLQVGDRSVTIDSDLFAVSGWAHLTLIINGNKVSSYVNGAPVSVQQPASALVIPKDENSEFWIGKDFKGRIDEFRIWKAALDETKYLSEDPSVIGYILWDNTLNKFHPQYTDLLLYCKFDQNLCANIVDYTFRHHGIMNGGVSRLKVTDNSLFKYRIVTDYFEMSRFTDVPTDKQKYLLCNDLLAIIGRLQPDGSIYIDLPFDRGVLSGGAAYMAEYEGRKDILSLDGTGKMTAGTEVMNKKENGYSFCTWLFIDEWVEGAFLLKREKNGNKGISLRLGKEEDAEVILRVNGNEYKYKNDELVKGKWVHLGFSVTGNILDNNRTFCFVCNTNVRKIFPYAYPETIQPYELPLDELKDVEGVIGENFKGKLDETIIWDTKRSTSDIMNYMKNGVEMPDFGKKMSSLDYIHYAGCYWSYDRPEDPGYDYFSYVAYLAIARTAYDGYRGCRFRLSITGGEQKDWEGVIASSELTEHCATEIAKLINDSEVFSGVDLDLEWPEYGGQGPVWTNYGKFIEVVRSKLNPDRVLTLTPHTVSYWFPKDKMKFVDYFLFQNYGPAKDHFTYSSFPAAYNKFLSWGYPKEKIVMSHATTTSRNTNGNVPNRVYNMVESEPDDCEYNGYSFMSVNQTRWRGEQIKKQDLGGLMCWSMNCDYPDTNNPMCRLRARSFALSSNVDTLITEVNMDPTGIEQAVQQERIEEKLVILSNPADNQISFQIPDNQSVERIRIFNMQGQSVLDKMTQERSVYIGQLSEGTYCITVQAVGGKIFKELFVKYK